MFCNDIWPLQPNELKTNKLSYLVLLLHTKHNNLIFSKLRNIKSVLSTLKSH